MAAIYGVVLYKQPINRRCRGFPLQQFVHTYIDFTLYWHKQPDFCCRPTPTPASDLSASTIIITGRAVIVIVAASTSEVGLAVQVPYVPRPLLQPEPLRPAAP